MVLKKLQQIKALSKLAVHTVLIQAVAFVKHTYDAIVYAATGAHKSG